MMITDPKLFTENSLSVILHLSKILHIPITRRTILSLRNTLYYPSLFALSNYLEELNISTYSTKINAQDLDEIRYPAIAHLTKNNGHFVVLQKFEGNQVHYFDSEIGEVRESITEFEIKWNGVVLLVEANEKSGEDGYEEKKKREIFSQSGEYLAWGLSIILLTLPFFLIPSIFLPYYFLKITGGAFCLLLLQKQLGSVNKSLSAVCTLGSKSNCDAVIYSPRAKLFGIFNLSEVGILYFLGSILSLPLSSFCNNSFPGSMAVLSYIAFPFTLVSVHYQWRVIRAWCPLCLMVMAIIWLEVLALTPLIPSFSFGFRAMIISFTSYSLPLVFWLVVRERFIDSHRIPNLEHTLYKFTRSEQVFQSLLSLQPETNMDELTHEIRTGNKEAPLTLTMVSNPVCGPCSTAHAAIEDLLDRFEDRVKVNFRFTVNSIEEDSVSNKMVRHIISLSLTEPNKCRRALSDWFLHGGRKDFDRWIEKNPVGELNGKEMEVDLILKEYANWFIKAGIAETPTLLINGRKYMDEYTLSDLKFQIRKLLESIPNHKTQLIS